MGDYVVEGDSGRRKSAEGFAKFFSVLSSFPNFRYFTFACCIAVPLYAFVVCVVPTLLPDFYSSLVT